MRVGSQQGEGVTFCVGQAPTLSRAGGSLGSRHGMEGGVSLGLGAGSCDVGWRLLPSSVLLQLPDG
eukprot:505188-Alexandrium_andersonii.AAC.1